MARKISRTVWETQVMGRQWNPATNETKEVVVAFDGKLDTERAKDKAEQTTPYFFAESVGAVGIKYSMPLETFTRYAEVDMDGVNELNGSEETLCSNE